MIAKHRLGGFRDKILVEVVYDEAEGHWLVVYYAWLEDDEKPTGGCWDSIDQEAYGTEHEALKAAAESYVELVEKVPA